jgi:NADPH-dependent 2,4-dienoyl-CoA reductase/sulfur reductase-like enzyme
MRPPLPDRRAFLGHLAAVAAMAGGRLAAQPARPREISADLVIVGGGFGGCAAALAAARTGLSVVMTEQTDWVGGQLRR